MQKPDPAHPERPPTSQYEMLTLAMSGIAILASIGIPLVGHIYKKIRKPRPDIYEFEYLPLTVMHSQLGNRIKLNFSIMSRNASCIIRSIEANVRSETTGDQIRMRWTVMEPIRLDWASSMGGVINLNSMTHVHPLLVNADALVPLSVHFEPINNENFRNEYEGASLSTGCEKANITKGRGLCNHPAASTSNEGLRTHKPALKECFWHCGSYRLAVKLLFNLDETFEKTYRFELSSEEADQLRSNATKLPPHGSCSANSSSSASYCHAVSKDIEKIAK